MSQLLKVLLFMTLFSPTAQAVVPGVTQAPARPVIDTLRPPSVPLVTVDPYFSVWSPADCLTDAPTCHWTGRRQTLTSLARIDGALVRLMGTEPASIPAARQLSLRVSPTRTHYEFEASQVRLGLTFLTALLPHDLEALSRPVTYLTWTAESLDGKPHQVQVYFEATAELAVNEPVQTVAWERAPVEGLAALRMGTVGQEVLAKRGDDLRIDWGYLYAATPAQPGTVCAIDLAEAARARFASAEPLAGADLAGAERPAADLPALVFTLDLDAVTTAPASRWMMLAYDDLYSIEYFNQHLRPWWRRNGADAAQMLREAATQYAELTERCRAFDAELEADLERTGGPNYVAIGALAWRQGLAANKLVADPAGMPLMFSKENFSNGCIGTVDVIYPQAPQFLTFNPALMRAVVQPLLAYASTPRWKFPFAPHDLGTYPLANGQVYGGGEETEVDQMPVEETGNMLLLMAGLARAEGTPEFALEHWPLLERWAEWLRTKGVDPENQLCTDDFAGHLAHNVNLSAKAIVALAAFAGLCEQVGKMELAAHYRATAEEYVRWWFQAADDGDHYRLAFDRPGSWSQKYNLVWDRLLDMNLFPHEVLRREMAFYLGAQGEFGLPLDSRQDYTKLDWITWTASLTGRREDFEALVAPIVQMLNKTESRVPMTDWYDTKTGKQSGFQARSVVGGVYVRVMDDWSLWRKWAGRAAKLEGDWAPIPARAIPQAAETATASSQTAASSN